MPSSDPNIVEATKWAAFYRMRGFGPLPSDSKPGDGRKKPLCRYRDYYEAPVPDGLFERFPTPNIQVITGRYWRLIVFDLDGKAGADWFFAQVRNLPKTWAVRSGGGGLHLWFRLPEGFARSLPKAFLWKGDDRHEGVERLCDRSLAMAPPSIHPVTGKRYVWANDGRFLPPTKLGLPALCPQWLLDLAPIRSDVVPFTPIVRSASVPSVAVTGHYRASDVRDAIPDIIGLVASWGLRFESTRLDREWVPCHAFDREDRIASAAVSRVTGSYNDKGSGLRLGLFDLAVALGQFGDWRDAVTGLGEQYRARQTGLAS